MNTPTWHRFFVAHPNAGSIPKAHDVYQQSASLPDPYSKLIWHVKIEKDTLTTIRYQITGSPIAMATCHWCAAFHQKHPTLPSPSFAKLMQQCQKDLELLDVEMHHCQWVLQAWSELLAQQNA